MTTANSVITARARALRATNQSPSRTAGKAIITNATVITTCRAIRHTGSGVFVATSRTYQLSRRGNLVSGTVRRLGQRSARCQILRAHQSARRGEARAWSGRDGARMLHALRYRTGRGAEHKFAVQRLAAPDLCPFRRRRGQSKRPLLRPYQINSTGAEAICIVGCGPTLVAGGGATTPLGVAVNEFDDAFS